MNTIRGYQETVLEFLKTDQAKEKEDFYLWTFDEDRLETTEQELVLIINKKESLAFYFKVEIIEDSPEEPKTRHSPGCPAEYHFEVIEVFVNYVKAVPMELDNEIELEGAILDNEQEFKKAVSSFLEEKLNFHT